MTARTVIALLSLLLLPFISTSQELNRIPLDTSAIPVRAYNPTPRYPDYFTPTLLPAGTAGRSSPKPLYLSLSLSSSLDYTGSRQNFDISSIWQDEILKQEKYKTIRMILGSIEAGGVAYLAYLHVKKYGFK